MAKIEEIRQTYLKDAETSGSKSKFGFFSVPPCATAGHNAFEQKKGNPTSMQSSKIKMEELKLKKEIFTQDLNRQECSRKAFLNTRHPFFKEIHTLIQVNMRGNKIFWSRKNCKEKMSTSHCLSAKLQSTHILK